VPLLKRLNDKQMTEALMRGDKDALLQLYKDNYISVRNYVLKNNGSDDDAEDILQDACIAIWEKCRNGSLELKARLSTIVFAIAKNLWLKRLNRLGKQVQMDGVNTEKMSERQDPIHQMDKQLLMDIMNQLGDKCRELLSLFYFDGYDMNKIAELMNYNNSDTVKAKKHQCFKHLQENFLRAYKKNDFLGN
jgi:RNA polymerase sigma factor (sigma-70 family)